MRILGIDPGLTGALAFIDIEEGGRRLVGLVNAPRLESGLGMLDVQELVKVIGNNMDTKTNGLVVIERQQAMPYLMVDKNGKEKRQGSASTFKTGMGYGIYLGILGALELPHAIVGAQTWQKEMYQGAVGEGKDRSIYIAQQLFPDLKFKKSHHGRADALLIAEYGRRRLI